MPARFYKRRGAVQIRSYGADYTIKNGNWVLWTDMLTDDELSEMKDVFAMFDKQNTGFVKRKHLGCILRTFGQMPTEDELIDFLNDVDKENSGTIEFPDFVMLMAKHRSDPEEDMKLAFEAFDVNGDKLISKEELKQFIFNIGEKFDEQEFHEIMDEIDADGDGFINYEEFLHMMTHS